MIKLNFRVLLPVLFLGLFSSLAFNPAKFNYYMENTGESYAQLWKKVDSLENQGLPKSALEVTHTIFEKAKVERNDDHFLRSVVYIMKLTNFSEENAYERSIYDMQKYIADAKSPSKELMHSMLGEMYWNYYIYNRWQFLERSQVEGMELTDIKTWDLTTLLDKTFEQYQLSVQNVAVSQKMPIDSFPQMITRNSVSDALYRPTVYDFLVSRAIGFFSGDEAAVSRRADYFQIASDDYLLPLDDFLKLNIVSPDSTSMQLQAIVLYQQWLAFRKTQPQKAPLLLADLERLQFAYRKSVTSEKKMAYFNALNSLVEKYVGVPEAYDVKYELARYYNENAVFVEKTDEFTKEQFWYKKKSLDLCNEIIQNAPKTYGGLNAVPFKNELLTASISFEAEMVYTSGNDFPIRLNWKNLQKAYVQVASIDYDKFTSLSEKYYGNELYEKLLKAVTVVKKYQFTLPDEGDLWEHHSDVIMDKLPLGNYIIIVSNDASYKYDGAISSWQLVQVSNLAFTKRRDASGAWHVYVKNRQSGLPLGGATVQVFTNEYNYTISRYKRKDFKKITTSADGYFTLSPDDYKESSDLYFDLSLGKDKQRATDYSYVSHTENIMEEGYSDYIFTDRSIYRPGQTVYFKVLSIRYDSKRMPHIIANSPMEVSLLDYNYQEVGQMSLTTNDFGTANGSFVLPGSGITGQFQIQTNYGTAYISVEEYKRPQFEVKLDDFDGNYMLGDEVTLKGTASAYSGAKLSDATVKYRIMRTPVWRGWWYRYMPTSEIQIVTGTLVTDANGKFTIPFKAIPDLSFGKNPNVAFNYSISVDVVDMNGETQSTNGNITVGYRALDLSANLAEVFDQSTDAKFEFGLITNNLNGRQIDAQGTWQIFSLKNSNLSYKTRYWDAPDRPLVAMDEWVKRMPEYPFSKENLIENFATDKLIASQSFDTKASRKVEMEAFSQLQPGYYRLVMEAKDAFGNLVQYQQAFTIIRSSHSANIYNTPFYVNKLSQVTEPGDSVVFLLSSADTLQLMVEIESESRGTKRQYINLNKNQQLFQIPVSEDDRGNFTVNFVAVHHNRFYQSQHMVYVPWSNKTLDISFRTFRDKMLPGQSEKWEIVIKDKLGDKVLAEMAAAMYDASLDAFAPNFWYASLHPAYGPNGVWSSARFASIGSQNVSLNFYQYYSYTGRYFPVLNWYGFSYYSSYYDYDNMMVEDVVVTASGVGSRRKSMFKRDHADSEEIMEEKTMNGNAESPVVYAAESVDDGTPPPPPGQMDSIIGGLKDATQSGGEVKVRSNFNETAFFQPQLYTNDSGEVVVSFTVPESLTRWKILGFAHTKNLEYGMLESQLVTQKELMVQPNLPRFFREGDEIEVLARISNLTDASITGNAIIELFDASTNKLLDKVVKGKSEVAFTADAQQNASVGWTLVIPEGVGAIVCRIKAISPKHTDAEERTIPVLTNRMLVTESLPLNVRGNQTKTFEFKKLADSGKSRTLKHHKLTLEFSSNPAWYAIQSLPYLMEYPYECYEQTFSRYYANALASHIVNSSPKIKEVFDTWVKKSPEAFLSNLEKNQELKALVLEETPWLLESKDEGERKRNVALLFDFTRMSNELKAAEKKLIKGQVSNGAWPWFDGMPESRYITQHIYTGMGKLRNLGVDFYSGEVTDMLTEAGVYLDKQIASDYEYLKRYYKNDEKELAKNHLSCTAIHYLYGRSFYMDADFGYSEQQAFSYYKEQAAKYWLTQSKYMQAMLAVFLYRYDDKETAMKIIASLKENSTSTEEMGMYFKDNITGYYWYEAPIETQAMIIEAFNVVGNQKQAVDDMRVWLLKQKQTTDWKTTRATVEAIYALLLGGESWLQTESNVVIQLGKESIDASKLGKDEAEAGTGYFKKTWSAEQIDPDMGKIKVTRTGEGPAWGAVYWQYFEQLDKITPHETPLKLTKNIFVERTTDSGKKIELITPKTKLEPGDKIIVRIELRTDRDMEYVHLKDMRASGFEPINVFSGYKWQDGLAYYESTRDASTNFFIEYLRKGTYVFEYPLRVAQRGDFSNGITTVQCMYAPEFTSHSEGIRVMVK